MTVDSPNDAGGRPSDGTAGSDGVAGRREPFSTRTVLVLAAVVLVADGVLKMVAVPLPYDTVVGVATLVPLLHLRGMALDSLEYVVYVERRSVAGFVVDSLSAAGGAVALGSLVVWVADRIVGPGSRLVPGMGVAAALIGGGAVLYLLVVRFVDRHDRAAGLSAP
ncbi:MAG: hypothetical protein ABEJ81_02130 [Haloferacaceae archaeon]